MNPKLKRKIKDAWDYQKLMNLDFKGGTRGYLMKKFSLSDDEKMGIFVGADFTKRVGGYHTNHTIAQVSLEGDEDGPDESYWDRCMEVYSLKEMIEKVDEFMLKYPNDTTEVFIGYEVLKPNSSGLMDICGESDIHHHRILIKKGEIIEGDVSDKLRMKD